MVKLWLNIVQYSFLKIYFFVFLIIFQKYTFFIKLNEVHSLLFMIEKIKKKSNNINYLITRT